MNKRPVIQLLKVHAGYDGKTVLRDVHLTIYENDFLGVIGPNGAGKTTLLNILSGMRLDYKGKVQYFDEKIATVAACELRLSENLLLLLGISYI